ncbi:hypothetical protein HNQ88_004450 [Aureibacter tunicatorum]|uniref:Uncharacterized protein n=1 Tax=Aureibacter tunicatorum TaxID=866807 RepID=A0AAE4BV27_9BACT|nr:hypothetical protein [Aureibacter tunicatorum]BDD06792.1 hypothetical protein AUTU_42750 [Aureibacter tunicatorum]
MSNTALTNKQLIFIIAPICIILILSSLNFLGINFPKISHTLMYIPLGLIYFFQVFYYQHSIGSKLLKKIELNSISFKIISTTPIIFFAAMILFSFYDYYKFLNISELSNIKMNKATPIDLSDHPLYLLFSLLMLLSIFAIISTPKFIKNSIIEQIDISENSRNELINNYYKPINNLKKATFIIIGISIVTVIIFDMISLFSQIQ